MIHRQASSRLGALFIVLVGLVPAASAWQADNGNGTFTNPLFYDEFSDPDLIRVGDDFYMTGTTMHTMPGLPILHSKDLVNWELLTYACDRLDLGQEFRLENGRSVYGRGFWAPSLRYHAGTFYLFSNVNGHGTQLFTATDPAGPWTHRRMNCSLHDLSVLFDDDGKVYVVWGYQDLHFAELNEDLSDIKPETEKIIIRRGSGMGEGVHFYKIDGTYYLISAWFSSRMRMPCARADRPDGPYEINQAISIDEDFGLAEGNRLASRGLSRPFRIVPGNTRADGRMSLHQGGIVRTPTGQWWGFSMMDYNSAGRMTALSPVTWKDGWPYFGLPGNLGRTPRTWVKPDTGTVSPPRVPYQRNDDFDGRLANVWQWNHVPVDQKWSLTERPGSLRLHALPAESLWWARNTLTQRSIGPVSIPTAELDTQGLQDGDVAGLALLNLPYAWVGVERDGEALRLVCYDQTRDERAVAPLHGGRVWLRAHCDFLTEKATFSYSTDGRSFEDFGPEFTMVFQLVTFQGVRYSLFCFNTQGREGGYADFNRFTVDEPHPRGLMRPIPVDQTIVLKVNGTGQAIGVSQDGIGPVRPTERGARFKVVDRGLGRVALVSPQGFLTVTGPNEPVQLQQRDPGRAAEFQWTENVYGDLILLSLVTHRFLHMDEQGVLRADAAGPHPNRRDGVCLTWQTVQDPVTLPRTTSRGALQATVRVGSKGKAVGPDLFGIFFEDINYAADGGLYAELVQNRSFEYSQEDHWGWHGLTAWEQIEQAGAAASVTVEDDTPLDPNNPHYAMLTVEQVGERVGLRNEGFDGMRIVGRDTYDLALFARRLDGPIDRLAVQLETRGGDVLARAELGALSSAWACFKAEMVAEADCNDARLVVLAPQPGRVALDMVSLFPRKTFKNRPNGLRADLAQVIADLKPKFVRFPGGCLAHGDGLENMYRWKDTIGPVHRRRAQRNIWRYHQTVGLGYFEYFQFCEDIGAKPLPVVPAGVCCQNSGNYMNLVPRGQQALRMDQMPAYVQEVLDLVEWANGPVDSPWGSRRAAAGHPEPFGLEYLGVGNEDVISETFKVRFGMIYEAVKARYPEITVIGTTGPFPDGRDYEEGWAFARELGLPMVDEHGYRPPTWFWQNLERFDVYPRTGTLVYLGEYAAHDRGRRNTLRSALAEAAYCTSLERNGDLVRLASYAPLLAKQGRTQWRPDLIYFDNHRITPSINYAVQQLFSLNQGDETLPVTLTVEAAQTDPTGEPAQSTGILLGAWDTQVCYDDVRVTRGGRTVLEDSFDGSADDRWQVVSGRWAVEDGCYVQSSSAQPAMVRWGFPDTGEGYELSCRARKRGGREGFLVGVAARDEDHYVWFNLGGWGNTQHGVERAVEGSRSLVGRQIAGRIDPDRWYDIRVQFTGDRVRCFLDGQLVRDVACRPMADTPDVTGSCVRRSATGEVIVKLVSKADRPLEARLDLTALPPLADTATCTYLAGSADAENRFGRRPEVIPQTATLRAGNRMTVLLPPQCFAVIRIPAR